MSEVATMTGGQALAGQLVREGVRDVFGVPGVQLDWAVDALCLRPQKKLLVACSSRRWR